MDSSGAVATGMPWHTARGLGSYGERMAVRYLTDRGLEVLDRTGAATSARSTSSRVTAAASSSARSRPGAAPTFGQPIEAVDHRKLARLRRLAAAWLADRRAVGSPVPGVAGIRVDVVGVLRPRRGPCRIEHVVGARLVTLGRTRAGRPARHRRVRRRRRGRHRLRAAARSSSAGCPDGACAQAPDRVKAAAANSGHPLPLRRVTVNLSPASIPKVGSGFDLAICVAALVASESIPPDVVRDVVHLGELGARRHRPVGAGRPARSSSPPRVARCDTSSSRSPTPPRRGSSPACGSTRSRPSTSSSTGMPSLHRGLIPPPVPEPPAQPVAAPPGPTSPRSSGSTRPGRALEVAAAGRSPPLPRRAARGRQDDARRAAAGPAAGARRHPGHGGHGHRVGPRASSGRGRRSNARRRSSPRTTAPPPVAVIGGGSAPRAARRDHAGAPRRALPRRGAGVPGVGHPGAAPADRVR